MCNPLLIVMAAGTALQLHQQQEQANQVNKAADVQDKNIRVATAQSYTQLNRQGIEDAQNQSTEQSRISREMAERVATGRAQAGGAGVAGLSVNAMLMDLAGKGLDAKSTSETNYARSVSARSDQAIELQNSATGQLGGIQRAAGVGALDVVGAGLKVGAAYYGQKAAEKNAITASGKGK